MKMGDAVKISNEMWHRSCCSVVDGLRSEWKLGARETEAEVGEFEGEQQKTRVLKIWKKKKTTLKRRSSQMGTSAVSIPVSAKTPKPKRKSAARGGKRSAVNVGEEGTTDRADENQESVVEARESELYHTDGDGDHGRRQGGAGGTEAGTPKMEVVDGRSLDAPRAASADGGEPSRQPQVSGSTQTAGHSKVGSESTRVRQSLRVATQRQNLPFICGNTTTSHNVAVNVQKLLSSLRNRHVPVGIPPNFANHKGLKKFLDFVLPNAPMPGRCRCACKASAETTGAGVGERSFYRALSLLCAGDGPLPRQSRSRRTQGTHSDKAREEGAPVERVNVR